MTNTTFEDRCLSNPQGVIADLLAQTTRQAKGIHELTIEVTRLTVLLKEAGVDTTAPKPKKIAGRKKKIETISNIDSDSESEDTC